MPTEPINDCEIDAYIDGELDLARRLAVEEHLAKSPEAAQRVLADLRARTALRLLQQAGDEPDARLTAAAERLGDRLLAPSHPVRAFFSRGRSVAAGVVLALGIGGIGLLSTQEAQASPRYVSNAVMAFHTGLLRADMPSQIESRVFDSSDVQRSTRIRVPTLPHGWRITDVQLFPSDDGPALQIMARTNGGQTVSIFAVRNAAVAPDKPVTIRQDNTSVAYWRHGDIAYALTGLEAPDALDLAAEDLADNRLS